MADTLVQCTSGYIYRVADRIGQGGFSNVYRGVHKVNLSLSLSLSYGCIYSIGSIPYIVHALCYIYSHEYRSKCLDLNEIDLIKNSISLRI